MKKTIKYIFLVILLIFAGYSSMMLLSWRVKNNNPTETVAVIANENTPSGQVRGEEEIATRMHASQNFKTPQITFGGDAIAMPAGEQSVVPEIMDLRSELLTTKSGQDVKFVLRWRTNKLCVSSIEYMKAGQELGKIISDDSYGFVHSAEIAPINYSTSYAYIVTAHDKWGNETKSDKLTFYTGAPKVSILDLLGGAFNDMFGWMKK